MVWLDFNKLISKGFYGLNSPDRFNPDANEVTN
jgi:hypothetical protein